MKHLRLALVVVLLHTRMAASAPLRYALSYISRCIFGSSTEVFSFGVLEVGLEGLDDAL